MVVLPPTRPAPRRDERGAVLPSPVVWLSIIAVVVAAIAFVATRDAEPKEREITTSSSSDDETSDSSTPTDGDTTETDDPTETPRRTSRRRPSLRSCAARSASSSSTTRAPRVWPAETLARVQEIGWNGIAADDWYGTIPATTVYFPPGMRDAAQMLALDLGIQRLVPADAAMSDTNLTVILTGALRKPDHPIGRSFTWEGPGYCAFRDWLDACSSRLWRVSIATRTWSA